MRMHATHYPTSFEVSYALSNTHHSESLKNKEFISVPELFKSITKIHPPEFIRNIEISKSSTLDISQKPMIQCNQIPKKSFRIEGNTLHLGESSKPLLLQSLPVVHQ